MTENKSNGSLTDMPEGAVASVADAVRIATEASLAGPVGKPATTRREAARTSSRVVAALVPPPVVESVPEPVALPAAPVASLPAGPVVAADPVPTAAEPPALVPSAPALPVAALPVPVPTQTTPAYQLHKMETMMTTAEELMSFQQGNVEAMIRSSQIWVTGLQDLGRAWASSAQAHLDETFGTVKAITGAKSVREAVELQSTLARTAVEKAVSEGGKLTDASLKLAEQTLAPITARLTLAAERFGRSAA